MISIKFIKKAINEAEKAEERYRVGAVVFKGKRILSRGHNTYQKSAKKLHPKFTRWPNSVHAEVDAILKARRNLKGASILVVRINKAGELRNSKPCAHCMLYLKHVGIKKVYYSTNDYPYIDSILI